MSEIAPTPPAVPALTPRTAGDTGSGPPDTSLVPPFGLLLPQQLLQQQQITPQLPAPVSGIAATGGEPAGKGLPQGPPFLPLPPLSGATAGSAVQEGATLPAEAVLPSPPAMQTGPVEGSAALLRPDSRQGMMTDAGSGGHGSSTLQSTVPLSRGTVEGQEGAAGMATGNPDSRSQPLTHAVAAPLPAATPQPAAQPHARPEFQVPQPLGQPGWGEAMMTRVSWQAAGGVQEARFHIHPPELGPVDVRVNVSREHASVQFLAHHVAVRDALEEALPRLREMLGANGLQLAQASISHHAPQDGGRGHGGGDAGSDGWRGGPSWAGAGAGFTEAEATQRGTVPVRLPRGLVDAYA